MPEPDSTEPRKCLQELDAELAEEFPKDQDLRIVRVTSVCMMVGRSKFWSVDRLYWKRFDAHPEALSIITSIFTSLNAETVNVIIFQNSTFNIYFSLVERWSCLL
jgi:hypothetical protein